MKFLSHDSSPRPLRCARRSYFLLLEMLIAFGLTAILLSALMGFYLEVTRVNAALEKEQAGAFERLYLSTRLAEILPRATAPSDKNKNFFFYTSQANDPSSKRGSSILTFGFDNGVKLDPAFSNHVLGRLYLNGNNELCLAVWPAPSRWELMAPPMKHEVLFTGVEEMKLAFYVPPFRNRKPILSNNKFKGVSKSNDLLKLSPTGEWRTEWQQEYQELPFLIKIELVLTGTKGDPLTFIYPLPQSRLIILYE